MAATTNPDMTAPTGANGAVSTRCPHRNLVGSGVSGASNVANDTGTTAIDTSTDASTNAPIPAGSDAAYSICPRNTDAPTTTM